jgi:hypothetical protein
MKTVIKSTMRRGTDHDSIPYTKYSFLQGHTGTERMSNEDGVYIKMILVGKLNTIADFRVGMRI